jgi:rhodanese-related sulfurtransferase
MRRPLRLSPKTQNRSGTNGPVKGELMTSNPFITPVDVASKLLGGPHWPQVVDVRLADDFAADPRDIPCSIHREEADYDTWVPTLDRTCPVVISCQRGLKVSQAIVARMRAEGWMASSMGGCFAGWRDAGLPLINRTAMLGIGWTEGAFWVTRRKPKIDRAACPWLIRRFIDPSARFLYVEPDQVVAVAARTGGIAYDIPGIAVTHVGDDCSFDTLMTIAGLNGFAPLERVAAIVRGADNARLDLAPEAAGLLAASLGLSHLAGDDDHGMIARASVIYDGLFAWAANATGETHNWPPKA